MRFATFAALFFSAISSSAYPVFAADHLDSPSVQADGSVDINDLYAFQSPSNPDNFVMVMTVNPLAGSVSGTAFNPAAVYELAIDVDGDAKPNQAYRFYFANVRRGVQRFIVIDLSGRLGGTGQTGSASTLVNGGVVTAGVFDDPFFFDLAGFQNGLKFTGRDFFAGANVSAIVIEVPKSSLPVSAISVAARTVVGGRQFDRMGRPAINTVLIPSARKNAFNGASVANDTANFAGDVQASLIGLGNSPARAGNLTSILLPDVLTFDTSVMSGFLNGRRLVDDVIDAELGLITNGVISGDGVNANDVPFQATFPYLAPAH